MITLPIKGSNATHTLDPRIIIGIGLNYRDHIAEHDKIHVQGFTPEIPSEPVIFPKTPNVLVGPDEPIVIPEFLADYNFEDPRIDYEAELAVIIKKSCQNVSRENALEHVFGFTCMNDITQRNLQRNDPSGWFRGKSLDTFGPIGPVIVPPENIDHANLTICARLNGREVQSSNTANLIFPVDELIAYISRQITLGPGDIISTGTPSGVGPITAGDNIEVEIQDIGTLCNPVIAAKK